MLFFHALSLNVWRVQKPATMSTTITSINELDFLDKNGETILRPPPPGHFTSQEVLVETASKPASNEFSKGRAAAIIVTVAGVNFLNTLGSGTLTVALPAIAKDLNLSRELLLWFVKRTFWGKRVANM